MLKVHNWWTFAGAILLVIIIYDLLSRGSVTVKLAQIASKFGLGGIKALEVPPSGS